MICRDRIVQARLNPEEFERYAPMVTHTFDRTWSDLIRRALLHLWKDEIGEQSDNGVIQSGHQNEQRPARPTAARNTKRPATRGRVKSKV